MRKLRNKVKHTVQINYQAVLSTEASLGHKNVREEESHERHENSKTEKREMNLASSYWT